MRDDGVPQTAEVGFLIVGLPVATRGHAAVIVVPLDRRAAAAVVVPAVGSPAFDRGAAAALVVVVGVPHLIGAADLGRVVRVDVATTDVLQQARHVDNDPGTARDVSRLQ